MTSYEHEWVGIMNTLYSDLAWLKYCSLAGQTRFFPSGEKESGQTALDILFVPTQHHWGSAGIAF